MSLTTLDITRAHFSEWYRRNRARSAELFSLVDPLAWTERPIPLRHPFAFYAGHLPAFSFLMLNRRALGEDPIDETLERLYERGIDPGSTQAARSHERSSWPSQDEVTQFAAECDRRVLGSIATAEPKIAATDALLEHEQMHHETLVYIIHRLDPALKGKIEQVHEDHPTAANEFRRVPSGVATLGAKRNEMPFGWDNEFDEHRVHVSSFNVQRFPVTNGEYLEFVRDGAQAPPFWIERDGEYFLRGVFEVLPLMRSWPVYVSQHEAKTYAHWKGKRLMTEAEFHRASQGTTDRAHRHGNYDFARYDAEPVDMHPEGASAWGVEDLIGNGWEITQTPFEPFTGFAPMPAYPQYSADFFDGRHVVYKGASPVTARELVRPSFRNWFYADYPYAYGKFRLVE